MFNAFENRPRPLLNFAMWRRGMGPFAPQQQDDGVQTNQTHGGGMGPMQDRAIDRQIRGDDRFDPGAAMDSYRMQNPMGPQMQTIGGPMSFGGMRSAHSARQIGRMGY